MPGNNVVQYTIKIQRILTTHPHIYHDSNVNISITLVILSWPFLIINIFSRLICSFAVFIHVLYAHILHHIFVVAHVFSMINLYFFNIFFEWGQNDINIKIRLLLD